jgi:hypothetical protein
MNALWLDLLLVILMAASILSELVWLAKFILRMAKKMSREQTYRAFAFFLISFGLEYLFYWLFQVHTGLRQSSAGSNFQ